MEPLFLDIEVVPAEEPEAFMVPRVEDLEPPANYKKPETIQAWREERAASLVGELREESVFEPLLGGIIVAVGVAVGNKAPIVMLTKSADEDGERDLLATLERAWIRSHSQRPVVTWNGFDYDLPFLAKRALRHGLFGLAGLCHRDKPWGDSRRHDLFKVWQQHDRRAKGKLSAVAAYLGIDEGEDPITGAGVANAMKSDPSLVVRHCELDIRRLRAIYWRFRAAGWVPGEDDIPDELPVREPRRSRRAALLREVAMLVVQLAKQDTKEAAERVGIAWEGRTPLEDGPVINDDTSVDTLERYKTALTAYLPRAALAG
jgi:hypothetical protein